jgi:hypothetical protein
VEEGARGSFADEAVISLGTTNDRLQNFAQVREIQSPKRIRAAIPSTGEYKNSVSDTVE